MPEESGKPERTLGDALAQRVEARRDTALAPAEALRELGAVDRAVYDAVARTPTTQLDGPVRRLSDAADRSRLWLGIAAAIALLGGRRGRRAALEGVVSIGVTSATVNLGIKPLAERRRPDRAGPGLFRNRQARMPASTSFPSGHAASAFAFAYTISRHYPLLAVPLRLLAGATAYSRVHTGVHYPGDVIVGSIVGAGTAATVAAASDRVLPTDECAGKASAPSGETLRTTADRLTPPAAQTRTAETTTPLVQLADRSRRIDPEPAGQSPTCACCGT